MRLTRFSRALVAVALALVGCLSASPALASGAPTGERIVRRLSPDGATAASHETWPRRSPATSPTFTVGKTTWSEAR